MTGERTAQIERERVGDGRRRIRVCESEGDNKHTLYVCAAAFYFYIGRAVYYNKLLLLLLLLYTPSIVSCIVCGVFWLFDSHNILYVRVHDILLYCVAGPSTWCAARGMDGRPPYAAATMGLPTTKAQE